MERIIYNVAEYHNLLEYIIYNMSAEYHHSLDHIIYDMAAE